MLRKTLATALVAAASVVALPGVAQADTPGVVTQAEFRRISHGMTISRVHRIFDTSGKQTYFYDGTFIPDSQGREYNTRSRWGYVSVDFEKRRGAWRVDSKSAYWG